jgi:predicted peptidase
VDALKMSNELNAVLELLWEIEDKYSLDDNRYYISGLSMGGFGTWDMIMRNPDLFAAAVPICGGADPHYAEKICDMPIYTVHGSVDPLVPVSGTRAMVDALKVAGSPVIYRELEGEEHGVWNWAAQNADLWEWLFSQSK